MVRQGKMKVVAQRTQLNIQCSVAELRRWKELSDQSGMTLSVWVRHTLTNGNPLEVFTRIKET